MSDDAIRAACNMMAETVGHCLWPKCDCVKFPAAIRAARERAIDEAAKAAHDAAGQFLSAEGRSNFILHGPGGMAMAMVAAVRALKAQ